MSGGGWETFTKNKRSDSAYDRWSARSTLYGMESPKLSDEPQITPASNVNQYRLQELIVIMLMSPTLAGGGGGV